MPEYASELVGYLQAMGDDEPREALENKDFLRRTLSADSPPLLVAIVAQRIERTLGGAKLDEHPAIAGLSAFEKGRIMSVLGRKEAARALYVEALAQIATGRSDPQQRGLILKNLANDTENSAERFALFHAAIEGGCREVLGDIGGFLYNLGRQQEAINFLLQGITEGEQSCVGMLGQILVNKYGKTLDPDGPLAPDFVDIMKDIFLALRHGGFEDVNAAFAVSNMQIILHDKDGKVVNMANLMQRVMAQYGDLSVWPPQSAHRSRGRN